MTPESLTPEPASPEPVTPVIDAHLHVWDTTELDISWVSESTLPQRTLIPDDDGPRSYVLVEADAEDPAQEAAWLSELARTDPRVHGLVVSVALEASGAEQELDRLADLGAVVGVRRLLQDRHLFDHPGLLRGLELLTRRDLPFDACVRAGELSALADLLQRAPGRPQRPELTVVLDHMGKPPVGDPTAMVAWRADLERLADLPNVQCKLSGLPAECRDDDELDEVLDDVVTTALGLFGPERCLVGSDRPVSSSAQDWCTRVLSMLPRQHRAAVGHDNAARIYRRRL